MLKRLFFLFIIILSISFLVIESFIIINSFADDDLAVDYIIILGAGLYGDEPSPSLVLRLQKALEYAQRYPQIPIVVSGGQGPDEWITEAEAMKRFLVQHDIEETRIIKEDRSTSTGENLLFTREVIRHGDGYSKPKVMIITSEYHIFRAKFLARRHGFIPYGIGAPTPAYPEYLKPYYYFREYFAVVKSIFFD